MSFSELSLRRFTSATTTSGKETLYLFISSIILCFTMNPSQSILDMSSTVFERSTSSRYSIFSRNSYVLFVSKISTISVLISFHCSGYKSTRIFVDNVLTLCEAIVMLTNTCSFTAPSLRWCMEEVGHSFTPTSDPFIFL